MRKLKDVFVKFLPTDRSHFYVSVNDLLGEHPDAYQYERDEYLYEWSDIGRGFCYNRLFF